MSAGLAIRILPLILLGCVLVDANIYSAEHIESLKSKWVELSSEQGTYFRSLLYSTGRRNRRAAGSDKLQPTVHPFVLINDTSHNQALIHWSGSDSQVIFILTRRKLSPSSNKVAHSTLWRSTDYGVTYKVMTDKFEKDTTILKSYFISPTNKSKVIFVDSHNYSRRIWLSEDEGDTYKSVSVPFSVDKIDFHPVYSDWLLGYDKGARELHCSQDFGLTWKKLGDEVSSDRYYWYIKNTDKGENAENIVFFEYRHLYSAIIKKIYKVKSCYIPDCTPTPFQAEIDKLDNIDQDSLVVQNSYIFVQKSLAENKLYVSHNRGPFARAAFPYYTGQAQAHFHIVNSEGGYVIIGINHDNGLTHLFISGPEGKTYRQSLSNMRYFNKKSTDNKVFSVDIYKIQGIIGTYVANVHGQDGQNTTKITWNNGQNWTTITSNVHDLDGQPMTQDSCSKCSLNLHLTMEQTKSGYYMQSVLSKASFPGLIVAHGTYGRTVHDNPSEVKLFISRDNGKSWHAIKEQRHFVVVTNHGAVIVAVKMIFLSPVSEFSFSSDYGKTWSHHMFTQHPINVDGILTEPGEAKPYITLFGHKTYMDSWKIFQIDVRPLFAQKCNHPDDFVNVTVPTQTTGTCHLGLKQKYERLKNGKHCLIASNYARVTTPEVCTCTRDDYECTLGYKSSYKSIGGVARERICERDRSGPIDELHIDDMPDFSNEILDNEANCTNGRRNVSSGFRKVPGNKCAGDVSGIYFKLENCGASSTVTPLTTQQSVSIKLRNASNIVQIGHSVVFSVQGTTDKVVWRVSSRDEKKPKTIKQTTLPHGDLKVLTEEPGEYIIRAEIAGTSVSSQWEKVQFWYPIKKVYLYHPPVIAQSKPYNVTAWTQTLYGLRGNKTLLGEVGYIWDIVPSNRPTEELSTELSTENTYRGKPLGRGVAAVKITVTVDNQVSKQSTTGSIHVKEYSVQLVLEMSCSPEMPQRNITDGWLEQFREAVINKLLHMEQIRKVKEEYGLTHEMSLYIYSPPGSPLTVHIYFAPSSSGHSKEKLLEAAKEFEGIVGSPPFTILLSKHMTATAKNIYIIDYDGIIRVYKPVTAGSGTLIAVLVVFLILLVVAGFLAFRHFSRKIRFGRYLNFRNLRPGHSRNSRIVRSQDRSPIVEEEFIDDDLNAMEEIGSQDATLQFQG